MKIISFARTTAALLAGKKTVTRREWKDTHAARFRVRELVEAWSASPHRGGRRIGVIKITALYRERTCLIPDEDWAAEGFAYMEARGLSLGAELSCIEQWRLWRADRRKTTWVIRFTVERVYKASRRRRVISKERP